MQASTISSRNSAEFKERIQARINTGFKANFCIIFASPKQSIAEMQSILNEFNIECVGCTSAGEIIDDRVMSESSVALLFELNKEHVLATMHHIDTTAGETAENIGKIISEKFTNTSLMILGGGLKNDGSEIVQGFKRALGNDILLFGGLAGDDVQLEKTLVFNNNHISDNGIVAVAFNSDKVSIKGMAISGWKGIGPIMEVTKSQNNIVYEINHTPAITLYNKFVGMSNDKDIVLEEGVKYPLQVFKSEDTPPVLRAPLFSTEDNGLMFPGGIQEGQKVRFCVPPDFDVIDSTIQEFQDFSNQNGNVDAMILFSCFARHIAFGPMIKKEIQGIHNVWQKPMIGFFTYGEIGNAPDSESDFHNETCSLLLISEN